MENGLSIQVFDQMPASPEHQLQWRQCEVTGILYVTVMNLKIDLMVTEKHLPSGDHFFVFEGWVKTALTNWQYLGDGFETLAELKLNALKAVAKQLISIGRIADSYRNFEQV